MRRSFVTASALAFGIAAMLWTGCSNDNTLTPGLDTASNTDAPEFKRVDDRYSLDIRPGSCDNPLNPKSKGVIWIALAGSDAFDVREVDVSSLRLRPVGATIAGVAPFDSRYNDVTGHVVGNDCPCPPDSDGYEDLRLKFHTEEIAQLLTSPLFDEIVRFELTGQTHSGQNIRASDCAKIVGVPIEPPPPPQYPDTEIIRVVNTYFKGDESFTEDVDIYDEEPDTVPYGSWLTLFYDGTASGSVACDDPVNQCLAYQMNYTSTNRFVPFTETSRWLTDPPFDTNPFGTEDSSSVNAGTVTYTLRGRAVEGDQVDVTPAEVTVIGNFDPTLDDFFIENYDGAVARDGNEIVWDWWNPANFTGNPGDTLDLSGPEPIVVREFYFDVMGLGHDHPKEADGSGVKSWLYLFRDSDGPSTIFPLGRAGLWVDGSSLNEIDDRVTLTVRYSLLSDPGGTDAFANLPEWVNQYLDMSMQGRDIGLGEQFRQYVMIAGEQLLTNVYPASNLARRTEEGMMRFRVTVER